MNNCINIILDLQLITQLYHLATSFYLKGYNDYAAKKIKRPRLSSDGLQVHIDALSDLLSLPWFSLPSFGSLRKPTEGLLSALYQYRQYLDGHCASVKATHQLPSIQLDIEKTSLVTISPSKDISSAYTALTAALQTQPDYSVVFLQDTYPMIASIVDSGCKICKFHSTP